MLLSHRDVYDLAKKLHYTSKFNKLLDDVIASRSPNDFSEIHVSIITKKYTIVNDTSFDYRGYKVVVTKHESSYIDHEKAILVCSELLPKLSDFMYKANDG